METLIPNLPEEIGLECLIRVPPQSLPLLRRVCRRWKQTAESPLFHRLRLSSGSSHTLIIFSQAHHPPSLKSSSSLPSFRLSTLRPSSSSSDEVDDEWSLLPSPLPSPLPLFCRLASSSPHLLLIGGWHPDTFAPSNSLYIYSFLSASWRRARPMPPPTRSFFACAAAAGPQNLLFVAGGHDADKNALRSALAYDIARDEWTPLPDMARERDECAGLFDATANLFRVFGGYCTSMQGRFERSAEAFDLAEWRWRSVEEEEAVPEGDGYRYQYACAGGGKEVPQLPEDVRVGARMVGWVGGLMVLGAHKAYVMERKEEGAALGWRRVEMPEEYSGYVQSACCIHV